jgi:hypothetical protein
MKKTSAWVVLGLVQLSVAMPALAAEDVTIHYGGTVTADVVSKLASSDHCLVTINHLPCESVANTIADKHARKKYLEDCRNFTLDESTGASTVSISGACEGAVIQGRNDLRNYPEVINWVHADVAKQMRAAGFAIGTCSFSLKGEFADYSSCQYNRTGAAQ